MNSKKMLFGVIVLGFLAAGCDSARFRISDVKNKESGVLTSQSIGCSVRQLPNGDSEMTCPDGSSVVIKNGRNGSSCTVEETNAGALILCEDGTAANVKNGSSCTVTEGQDSAEVSCSDGSKVVIHNGQDGINGTNGADGTSCSVAEEPSGEGVLITCGAKKVLVKNGKDAPSYAYQVVDVVNPCRTRGGAEEVLLHFANGEYLAHYSDGVRQFLTLIKPNITYQTTDSRRCLFKLTDDGKIHDLSVQ